MLVLFADGIHRPKFGIKTLGEQFDGVTVETYIFTMKHVLRVCKCKEVGNCQQFFAVNETSN